MPGVNECLLCVSEDPEEEGRRRVLDGVRKTGAWHHLMVSSLTSTLQRTGAGNRGGLDFMMENDGVFFPFL